MTIASILHGKGSTVFTLHAETTVQDAARLLNEHRVGALVITDPAAGVIGILSERDIVRVVSRDGGSGLTQHVGDVMTRDVVLATPLDTVDEALAQMTDRRIRHLPVVDHGRLIGVVSIGDLVKRRIDDALTEANAMRAYIATG